MGRGASGALRCHASAVELQRPGRCPAADSPFQGRWDMTLTVEGPQMYRRKIAELLRGRGPSPGGIAANPIGKVILGHVEARPQQVTITRSRDDCNASTLTDGREDDAHPAGRYYY